MSAQDVNPGSPVTPSWRELDQRESDGVRTTLEWCADTNEVWVRCDQLEDEAPVLCCRVAPGDAPRAFLHPYAYAYAKLVCAPEADLAESKSSRWARLVRSLRTTLAGAISASTPHEWI